MDFETLYLDADKVFPIHSKPSDGLQDYSNLPTNEVDRQANNNGSKNYESRLQNRP